MHLSVVLSIFALWMLVLSFLVLPSEYNDVVLHYWLTHNALQVSVSITLQQHIFSLKLMLLLSYSSNLSVYWCEIASLPWDYNNLLFLPFLKITTICFIDSLILLLLIFLLLTVKFPCLQRAVKGQDYTSHMKLSTHLMCKICSHFTVVGGQYPQQTPPTA